MRDCVTEYVHNYVYAMGALRVNDIALLACLGNLLY